MRAYGGIRIGAVLLRLAPIVVLLAIAFNPAGRAATPSVHALPSSATGVVSVADHDGGAIVTASDLAPGQSVSGMVKIVNAGDGTATLTLGQSDLQETPGGGGGRLSDALIVTVDDLTANFRAYQGPMSQMRPLALATLPSDSHHDFRFTVALPRTRGNAYQGGSTTVTYDWTTTQLPAPDPGTTTPPPTGGGGGGNDRGTPPVDVTPPLLTLAGKAKQSRKRPLAITAKCDEACALTATAKLSGAGFKKLKLPRPKIASRAVKAGVATKIGLKLPKKTLKKMKRAKKAKLTFTVTARDAAGNVSRRSRTLTLSR